jgi:polysaccharide pyruvyl transferase WcaK-like protein
MGMDHWRRWAAILSGEPEPRVVLHGGYGKLNMGDDAILHVLLGEIRQAMPDARITVVCHGPGWVRERYEAEACHFASQPALRAILDADLYIIGGGGIVNRINTYSGRARLRVLDPKGKVLFLAARLAGVRGAHVEFHAIGATSVPDPLVGMLARWSLGRADAVSVRDPLSYEVLRGLGCRQGIPVVPDPAMRLVAAPEARAWELLRQRGLDPAQRLIGLNLRPVGDPASDNARTARTMARLVDWMVHVYDALVCFIPFGRHQSKPLENDLNMALRVRDQVRRRDCFHILDHDWSPPEAKAVLGAMGFCLVERLHAALLAAGAGTPVAAICYDQKVDEFMRLAGLGERAIPLAGLTFESARDLVRAAAPWSVAS